MKKVTAVLPARNCRQELQKCLSALSRSSYIPRIIVVDDGSDDGTRQMILEQWPHVTYLPLSAHTGFAHAANAGLRLVQTEYAFLIRPDMKLRPGRKCTARLLQAMESDVFCAVPRLCDAVKSGRAGNGRGTEGRGHGRIRGDEGIFFPELAVRKRKQGSAAEVIAVPDGCAMYRMEVLEEIGWFDERHFDGLEALDLTLRAALAGARTVQVPGARVRPADGPGGGCAADSGRNAYGVRVNTFRRQMTAGNAGFVFYKNLPLFQRALNLPALTAVERAQAAAFAGRGEIEEYRMARERGRALCALEKERREALADGVSVWAETLADASFLGMEEPADRMYPLFLAQKAPFSLHGLPECAQLQRLLIRELPAIRDLLLD